MIPGRTVLLIEWDDAVRDFIETALTEEGYHVLVANKGTEALSFIGQHPVDIIVMDTYLPDTDSTILVEACRRGGYVPVILLSTSPHIDSIAVSISATDYLRKPFDLEALLTLIDQHISPTLHIV